MRILNRPMFKYGGPIKEGLMHGMKNGGTAGVGYGLVGDQRYPKTGGREHHVAFLPALYGAGAAALRFLPNIYRGIKASKYVKGWKPTGQFRNVGDTLSKSGKKYSDSMGGLGAPLRFKEWATSPYRIGAAIRENPGTALTLGSMGATGATGAAKLFRGSEPDPINIRTKSGVPGGGDPGMYYEKPPVTKSAEELAAEAKAARTKKLNKYLDTMGYDKAKKTAMGDALIDASAIVQDATSEAGSLKHADWGKMINKAIQTTSKRLDKPEQIREAVGLMLTKSEIEKDMEDPQTKELRRLQIKGAEKALAGKTTAELIQERMLKGDYPSGKNLARLVSLNNPGANIKVIPSTGMDVDVDTIEYITKVVEKSHKEGRPMPEGNYVIKDRIIHVDETGKITPIPISALK